jgi:hypothetical protein
MAFASLGETLLMVLEAFANQIVRIACNRIGCPNSPGLPSAGNGRRLTFSQIHFVFPGILDATRRTL